ncbi:MAG: hypothetical protein JSW10_09690 [Pseudomonadota bacterium]|nr:MAG: hypothetical protein JSW10_09690 [Pseudomonadota bacterium]
MGVLDDLRQQADGLKEQQLVEQEQREALEAFYRERILPQLEAAYTYLSELVQHLNVVQPDVRAAYDLTGFGRLGDLRQRDYAVRADSRQNMREVMLEFVCEGQGPVEFDVRGKENIERQVDYLRSTGLAYTQRQTRDDSHDLTDCRFIVQTTVPASFTFRADIEKSAIELALRNFEHFGTRRVQLLPDQISDRFFDGVGLYLLREDSAFFTHDISSKAREELQARIKTEQTQRERELTLAEERERAERAAKQERRPRLLGAFKKLGRRA